MANKVPSNPEKKNLIKRAAQRREQIVHTIANVGQIGAPAQVRRDSIQSDEESRKQQYGYRCHRTQKCGSLFQDFLKLLFNFSIEGDLDYALEYPWQLQ